MIPPYGSASRRETARLLLLISIGLVFVDDLVHVWKGPNGGNATRGRARKERSSPLKCSRLTKPNAISFLGLSSQLLPGIRFFMSQPGYSAALLAEDNGYKRKQKSRCYLTSTRAQYQRRISGGSTLGERLQETDYVYCMGCTHPS